MWQITSFSIFQKILLTFYTNIFFSIICTYSPTEEASATDKDTFYSNLTDCIHDVPLHNFVVLMGDLNARIGPSNAHLKTVGRYPYHKETNNNGNRLLDLCEANNVCITTTGKPHPDRHKWSWQHPNVNKAQLDHVILRGKWIISIRNCSCYNTVEIDSDHRIVTAAVKFSFRTTKKTPNITMYYHKAIISNKHVWNKSQLDFSNQFEHLYINDEDSVQAAYDKLEKVLN